jgi:hypothetical protein
MVEAVLVFALLSAIFEAVLLLKLPLRFRLRMLGSGTAVGVLHTLITVANLLIHWGTLTGSMTAVVAGLASFATVPLVRWYGGYIQHGRYFPGVKRYDLTPSARQGC